MVNYKIRKGAKYTREERNIASNIYYLKSAISNLCRSKVPNINKYEYYKMKIDVFMEMLPEHKRF